MREMKKQKQNINQMLEDIVARLETGEIIALSFQYVTSNGKMWIKSADGDFEVPQNMIDDSQVNYDQLTGKGN